MLQHEFVPIKLLIPYFGIERKIVGVEIGVLGGSGSHAMLLHLPNLTLYSIDPWQHVNGDPLETAHESKFSQEILDINYRDAKHKLSKFSDRSIILRKPSDDAVGDVPKEIDFVFIDGNHKKAQVLRDIKNYGSKVKKGGMVIGHDYRAQKGVRLSVDESFKKEDIHCGEDDTWWVYK